MTRLKQPQFAGYTGEEYIADSIIHPSDYVVPNYADGLMPQELRCNSSPIKTWQT